MNICMMTNTYLPQVCGVSKSVSTFAAEYRRRGHKVLVVAPEYEGQNLSAREEKHVERLPAIQKFNGSDYSICLPLAASLSDRLDAFNADIIHAHQPFLLGSAALRTARKKNVPIILTYHTRYEDYTHYVPFESPGMREAAISLSIEFANLCDGVIAPSESMAALLLERGVERPIKVVPTGIDLKTFGKGKGSIVRKKLGLPADTMVVGHVGRLAKEKNLEYLAEAVAIFIKQTPGTCFLVVGTGPAQETVASTFEKHGIRDRLHLMGKLSGVGLANAYNAMDVFVFASQSETQGLVLAEAMATGVPVVAHDASGAREVVRHGVNGFLLPADTSPADFALHLAKLHQDPVLRKAFAAATGTTAKEFSREHCSALALSFYQEVRHATRSHRRLVDDSVWEAFRERLGIEWDLLSQKATAVVQSISA